MHLIHKLRRSISHRPRHIFDLPDEILCLILEYCCQDLDFLLWSCPLVTLPDQFCHDCFHCTFCHGQIPFIGPRHQRSHRSSNRVDKDPKHDRDGGTSSSNHIDLGKRRRRCYSSSIYHGSSKHTDQAANGAGPSSRLGARPCPRNGNRPWCHHLQQHYLTRKPFFSRLFSSVSLLPAAPRISYIRPPTKIVLSSMWQHLEGLVSYLSFSGRQQHSTVYRESNPRSGRRASASQSTSWSSASSLRVPSYRCSIEPHIHSSRSDGTQDGAVHRRRTVSLSAHIAENASSVSPISRSQNSSGSTGGRRERYPAQDDGGDSLKSLSPDDTEDDCESEEDGDDFDDSIHLSGPFRNLLVSRRFADAAVQTLWRNLVFHGHDKYQMQSLLSTLNKEDHFDFDTQALDLHNIQDMDEESGNDTEGSECQPTGDCITNTRSVSKGGINTFNKATVPPSSWTFECQGASRGWIESLNSSLKRFSGLQRLPEDQNPYAKLSTEAVRTSFSGQRRHTAAGSQMAHNRFHTLCGRFDHNTPSSENSTLARLNLNQSRWPYRRHVRRVVLNFAHPQASPQMLVSVLECIGQRCRDQIQALDLHANEKMQEAGLEKTIELERLFGSGFAKLRYLRLQGGFVDNQLLYALIKGYTTNTSRSSTLELDLNDHDNLDTKSNLHCRSPSPSPSVSTAVPCRLSQVFLGPGSVTDSAVEKLIGAAGHSLEVFTVTSCVDVGGSALASLLTKCPKLRVLGVHRSLARDRDLLEGLGIEMEDSNSQQPHHPQTADALSLFYNEGGHAEASSTKSELPRLLRKTIVAPLERLELGTVKLTSVGVAEILKGTSNTLRFLVLETQHFNEELLTEVIMGHCTRLEGLYFDCPEDLQRLQRQMQGLGFSAGRRGAHLPNWHFWFGRSGRTFYSDPDRSYRSQQFQPTHHHQHHQRSMFAGTEGMERPSSSRAGLPPKVSAWLGETTTEEWVAFGDCALWSTAASPGVSFENGGGASFMPGGLGGGFFANNQQRRRQIQPSHYAYYHAYHNPTYMATIANSYLHSGPTSGFIDPLSRGNINHPFLGEYDDVLERYHVSKQTIENVLRLLTSLRGFTVMQMDFILESQGLSEWKMLMRQEEIWLQSTGFRALQLFYLCLFLGTIYIGTFAR